MRKTIKIKLDKTDETCKKCKYHIASYDIILL